MRDKGGKHHCDRRGHTTVRGSGTLHMAAGREHRVAAAAAADAERDRRAHRLGARRLLGRAREHLASICACGGSGNRAAATTTTRVRLCAGVGAGAGRCGCRRVCWRGCVGLRVWVSCGGVGAATSSEKSPAAAGSSTAICSSPSWSDMLAAGALALAAPWSRELPSVEPTCKAGTSISADLGRVDRVAPRGIHVDGDVAHRRRVLWRRE